MSVDNQITAAPLEQVMGDGEASIIECLAAGEPFVFDPATNFLHADDGTLEGGIRYLPADQAMARDIRGKILEYIQLSYDLSTWAACINWRGKENQKEWLSELREKIEAVQEAATILRAAVAVVSISPAQTMESAVERLQTALGREGVYVHKATAWRSLRAAFAFSAEAVEDSDTTDATARLLRAGNTVYGVDTATPPPPVENVAPCNPSARSAPSFDPLLDAYWNAAYSQGKEGRTCYDKEGSAQIAESNLCHYVESLRSELILAAAAFDAVNEKLSTARAEGRREGLEEAAKVAERVAKSYDDGSDQRADDLMWGCVRDIRAKIEEMKL